MSSKQSEGEVVLLGSQILDIEVANPLKTCIVCNENLASLCTMIILMVAP